MQLISTLTLALTAIGAVSAVPQLSPHQLAVRDTKDDIEAFNKAKGEVPGDKQVRMDSSMFTDNKDIGPIGSFSFGQCIGAVAAAKHGSILAHYSCHDNFLQGFKGESDFPDIWNKHKDDMKDDLQTWVYAMTKGDDDDDFAKPDIVEKMKKIIKDTTGKDPEVVTYLDAAEAFLKDGGEEAKDGYDKDKVDDMAGGIAIIPKRFLGLFQRQKPEVHFMTGEMMKEACKKDD